LIQAAKKTNQKTERMNIRMSKIDMESLKLLAAREGLPYQSLVTSILHYTLGQLIDINEVQKILKYSH
jgi:predicted DNA binding CopG/RHH family protein